MGRSASLCDAWDCPAAASCAIHFGRSRAYVAMARPGPELRARLRPVGKDHCNEYVCDRPRAWLLPASQARPGRRPPGAAE